MKIPNEEDAKRILKDALGLDAIEIKRFPTGLAHYVYDVTTQDGQKIVVRIAREDLVFYFEGAIYWHRLLKPKGVPLPEFIYTALELKKHGFPVIIMQRLPGKDLGEVYPSLSVQQKKSLAKKIVGIQKIAGTLPRGKGFSYATSDDSFMGKRLKKSWMEHLEDKIERDRKRIDKAGIFDGELIKKLKKLIYSHEDYFSKIQPKCFIDDTTTKNVIVDNGHLTGIVDIDSVCFGDELQVPALTKMSLIGLGCEIDYIDYWLEELQINQDQEKAFNIYLAMYCFSFMSEMGHKFNKDMAEEADKAKVEWFKEALDNFVSNASSKPH